MIRQALVALPLLVATAAIANEAAPPQRVAWARAALARMPVSKHDNTPERLELRGRQLDAFALEMARVAERAPLPAPQWIALMTAQGSIESNFDSAVVNGKCKDYQCDPQLVKGVRVFKAVGAFQQQNVAYVNDIWPSAAGNIPAQVEMVDRSLRRSLGRCKPFAAFPAHVFRAYSGGSCSFPVAREAERVAAYVRALATATPKAGS